MFDDEDFFFGGPFGLFDWLSETLFSRKAKCIAAAILITMITISLLAWYDAPYVRSALSICWTIVCYTTWLGYVVGKAALFVGIFLGVFYIAWKIWMGDLTPPKPYPNELQEDHSYYQNSSNQNSNQGTEGPEYEYLSPEDRPPTTFTSAQDPQPARSPRKKPHGPLTTRPSIGAVPIKSTDEHGNLVHTYAGGFRIVFTPDGPEFDYGAGGNLPKGEEPKDS